MAGVRVGCISLVRVVVPKFDGLNVAHELITLRRAPAATPATALVSFVGGLPGPFLLGSARNQACGLCLVITSRKRVRGVPAGRHTARRVDDRNSQGAGRAAVLGDRC